MPPSIQEIIYHLSVIPEHLWCTETHTDEYGRHCAQGHMPNDVWRNELVTLCGDYKLEIIDINDGKDKRFTHGSPKQRVLQALRLVELGEML